MIIDFDKDLIEALDGLVYDYERDPSISEKDKNDYREYIKSIIDDYLLKVKLSN